MLISSQVFCGYIKYLEIFIYFLREESPFLLLKRKDKFFGIKKRPTEVSLLIRKVCSYFDNNAIASGKSIFNDLSFSIVGTPSLFQPRRLYVAVHKSS